MKPNQKTPGQIAYEVAREESIKRGAPYSLTVWDGIADLYKQAYEAAATAVLADQWRPVSEPPENGRQRVFVIGGKVEAKEAEFCHAMSDRTHWMPIPPLPQPPVDPYESLKKAFADGATIQINTGTEQAPVWHDTPEPAFKSGYQYRTTRPLPPTKEELDIEAFYAWWADYKLTAIDRTPNRETAYAAWKAAKGAVTK